jgi:Glycosyl hydrolase family 12
MRRLTLGFVASLFVFAAVLVMPAASASAATPATTFPGPGTHPCTDPNYVSSSPSSANGYTSKLGTSYVVSADVWNDVNIHQTMSECAQNSWRATEQATGTAVQAYPNTNDTFGPDETIGSYRALTSNYRYGPVPAATDKGDIFEGALDVWLGPQTEWQDAAKHTEMMIWNYVDQQVPAGSIVGTATIGGVSYNVWFAGGIGQSNGDIVTYEATTNSTHGQIDLLSFFENAAASGDLEAGMSTYLWQVGTGYEICQAAKGSVFGMEAANVESAG